MTINLNIQSVFVAALLSGFSATSIADKPHAAPQASAAESELRFRDIPLLNQAFIDASPEDKKDGLTVGKLGTDNNGKELIVKLAETIAKSNENKFDSLLIAHKGKLLFESYYLRGRVNLPHPQASATKAYIGLALGRAIQLGFLSMADLHKPLVSFLKHLDTTGFAQGIEKITLHHALTMRSGLRLSQEQRAIFDKYPSKLEKVKAYLNHSAPITSDSQNFLYQGDPRLVMQVIDAVVPGFAEEFIKKELLDKMGITNYRWQNRVSMRSRDMVKWGLLAMNKGKWEGEQLIPATFIKQATSRIHLPGDDDIYGGGKDVSKQGYGYYWWSADLLFANQRYFSTSAQGGGGQFIILIKELDLLVVVTGHNNDNNTLQVVAESIIPAFIP